MKLQRLRKDSNVTYERNVKHISVPFTGRVAFVTGASRGIGNSIAELLLRSGIGVAIGYNKNYHLAEDLAKKYPHSIPIQVDISNRKSITNAIRKCRNFFEKDIDIVINNAAVSQLKKFEEISDNDWDNMFITNLRSAFIFSQELIPSMMKNRWGRIVNITSIGGQWGGYNQVHYAASKAGLINLTMSLAKIYSKYGITVNAVSPGLVKTDMTFEELHSTLGKMKVRNIPLGRVAIPKEIASVVRFLCLDDSSYITGQTINVNGGMYFG